jgi:hypothetical protein
MTLPIMPYSPLPANIQRTWNWGENTVIYDTGEQQADSPFLKPLLQWMVDARLFTEIRQSSLEAFQNATKGMTRPFLMKDPYEFYVGSVIVANSGVTNAATLTVFDTRSYSIRPDTLYCGSLFSSLSGYVRLGTEYSIDQDTGILTVNTKAAADVWRATSLQYYRKAKFSSPYQETSVLWNIFAAQLQIVELP